MSGPAARHRRLGLLLSATALAFAAPGAGAAASTTVRLSIEHVVAHCHVWAAATGELLGAKTRITVDRGARVEIRADCPMDFDFSQTRGPRLVVRNRRTYAGTSRVVVFGKPGLYRFRVKNVQTPAERGLETLGETNTLVLTVVVRAGAAR